MNTSIGSLPVQTEGLDRPKRCPKCDHIVKYEDKYQAHCDGCGILLRSVDILPTKPFDPDRDCYLCWRLSSADCAWVCADTKRTARIDYGYRVETETKQFTCQSGKHTKTESKVIGRTPLQQPAPPRPDLSTAYALMGIGLLLGPLGAISDQARTATEKQLGVLLYLVPLALYAWACYDLIDTFAKSSVHSRKGFGLATCVLVVLVAMWLGGLFHLLADYQHS